MYIQNGAQHSNNFEHLLFCRYGNSFSTDVSWQQSSSSCHCITPSYGTCDLGDAAEDEEVQRDPRASSTLLLEEAQVGYDKSFSAILHQTQILTLRSPKSTQVLW